MKKSTVVGAASVCFGLCATAAIAGAAMQPEFKLWLIWGGIIGTILFGITAVAVAVSPSREKAPPSPGPGVMSINQSGGTTAHTVIGSSDVRKE